MKDAKLIAALEEVAGMLGVKVRYERIKKNAVRQPKGGLCRVRDEDIIIVHKPLTDEEKVQVLADALREFDLEGLYMTPEVRAAIEGAATLIK